MRKAFVSLDRHHPPPRCLIYLQVKRAHIEAGVAGFTEKFEAVSIVRVLFGVSVMGSRRLGWIPRISQAFQPIPAASSGNQEAHPPGRESVERARTSEDVPGSLTEADDNVGAFPAPRKDMGDDAGPPLLSSVNYHRVVPQNTKSKISCRLVLANRRLSNDWMERSQRSGTLLLLGGGILKSGWGGG